MKTYLVLLIVLLFWGCEAQKQPGTVLLKPPAGQAAERFGTDREGIVNFHLWALSVRLDAEHKKAVEFAERLRALEAQDPNDAAYLDLEAQYELETQLEIEKAIAVEMAVIAHRKEMAALKAEKKRIARQKEKEKFDTAMSNYYNDKEGRNCPFGLSEEECKAAPPHGHSGFMDSLAEMAKTEPIDLTVE